MRDNSPKIWREEKSLDLSEEGFWFVQQGIEVWSAREGEQCFDSHVDKLLNYIRFWQASGESEITSIRVKTKHTQMVQDGQYRGGNLPYGYKLEHQGRTLMNDHMNGEFPVLKPGANAVSWTGTVTKVVIRPNWRYL